MSSRGGELGVVGLVLLALVVHRLAKLRALAQAIQQPTGTPNPPSSPQPAPNNPPHANAPGWPGGPI